jgi:galactonate dehydratase
MQRRSFLALGSAGLAVAKGRPPVESCECSYFQQAAPVGSDAFANLHSRIKITNVKVFGVSLTKESDRPYVFVKLETNQGLIGWGVLSRARPAP